MIIESPHDFMVTIAIFISYLKWAALELKGQPELSGHISWNHFLQIQ